MNAEDDFRMQLRTNAAQLLLWLDEGVPRVLLARQVASIVHAIEGLAAREFWECFADRQRAVARQRAGFCQHCDCQCPPEETHPFVCEACERRLDAEIERLMDGGEV